jgi:hypothetical protein
MFSSVSSALFTLPPYFIIRSYSFFSCVFVYIVAGCIYNWQFNNKTDVEMIPNLSFWMDLPSLCMDGFRYLISGFKETAGQGSYVQTA